jgi:hypothetical protein
MVAKLTRLAQNSDTIAFSGRKLYSPETFRYTHVRNQVTIFEHIGKFMYKLFLNSQYKWVSEFPNSCLPFHTVLNINLLQLEEKVPT